MGGPWRSPSLRLLEKHHGHLEQSIIPMILTTQYCRVLPLPASLAATSLLPKHNASRMRAAVGGFRGLVGMRSGVWIHVSMRLANGLVQRERALLEDTGITKPPLLRPTVDSRKRVYACGVFSVKAEISKKDSFCNHSFWSSPDTAAIIKKDAAGKIPCKARSLKANREGIWPGACGQWILCLWSKWRRKKLMVPPA